MKFFPVAIAAALMAGAPLASRAASLQPLQSQKIDLGPVVGDAYYTVGPHGYDVVATFAQKDGAAPPVRVEAVLKPGQTVIFSTPGSVGGASQSVVLARRENIIEVNASAAAK